jgi:DNA-binding response OmpR family regulator
MGRKGIQIDGQDVKLTRCELSIFRVLAAHPNVMVSAEELQKEFFVAEEGADTTNVRVHIGALRHKIESACPDIAIRTKYGGGYILTCGGSGEE